MIYVLAFVVWVLLVAIALALFSRGTGCGRDCQQGRNCSCRRESDHA